MAMGVQVEVEAVGVLLGMEAQALALRALQEVMAEELLGMVQQEVEAQGVQVVVVALQTAEMAEQSERRRRQVQAVQAELCKIPHSAVSVFTQVSPGVRAAQAVRLPEQSAHQLRRWVC
jgi:orotidine-5'-phosphate decarboxylase